METIPMIWRNWHNGQLDMFDLMGWCYAFLVSVILLYLIGCLFRFYREIYRAFCRSLDQHD